MLSSSLKILILCFLCIFSLNLHGQAYVSLSVDGNAISSNKTNVDMGSIGINYVNSKNLPFAGMEIQLSKKSAKTVGVGPLVNDGILNGIYFKSKFGAAPGAYPIRSFKNLLQDGVSAIGRNQFDGPLTAFDFYLVPSEVTGVMEPGVYAFAYEVNLIVPPYPPGVKRSPGASVMLQTKDITFTITVRPYVVVEPVSTKPVQMIIDNFSFFKNGYKNPINQSVRQTYRLKSNSPVSIAVATATDQFNFTKDSENNSNTGVNAVNAVLSVANQAGVSNVLGKNPKYVSATSDPNNGYTNVSVDFEILPEQLRNSFFKAGNYKTDAGVVFTPSLKPGTGGGMGTPVTMSLNAIEVIVKPLSDLRVNINNIDLTLLTANDYQNGISTTAANNLTFSSNSKYNITVKAGSDKFFGADNTATIIPCGILYIGSVNQNGDPLKEVQLSPSPQNILTGNTAFETNSGIRYTIKPSAELIKAKKGTYSIEVIYGITAQ